MAGLAQEPHARFHFDPENDPPLAHQIETFWQNSGFPFPGVSTPWSAVFVSSCVKEAGATKSEFNFNPQHSQFVHTAIQNGLNGSGVFRAHPVTSHAPAVGDIIQNNRGGNTFDFDFARKHDSYLSHSAIVVEVGADSKGGFALTIGGDESDSIRRTVVRLTSGGLVQQRTSNPFICVIENRK